MSITFFKILDSVLSHGISDCCSSMRISETEAIEKAKEYLVENSEAYYTDNPKIEYHDPLCRIAYLYTYVGAHANLIDNSFYKFENLKNFLIDKINKNETLHICSLGGGPGSELLGFVKFIERLADSSNFVDIYFTLIDSVREWDETWYTLIQGLEETFKTTYGLSRRKWPIVVHRSFLPLDLTDPSSFEQFVSRFKEIQIYVLNHTVSELIGNYDNLKKVFDIIVERATSGSYFLIIDRNQDEVKKLVESLLESDRLTTPNIAEERSNMDLDEQKTDLGRWYSLMQRDPKVSWNVFYVLTQRKDN